MELGSGDVGVQDSEEEPCNVCWAYRDTIDIAGCRVDKQPVMYNSRVKPRLPRSSDEYLREETIVHVGLT